MYLIDHGAALYFHHNWNDLDRFVTSTFKQIAQHVLLPWAASLDQVAPDMSARLTVETFAGILAHVPEEWMPRDRRDPYVDLLTRRLSQSSNFVGEALRARANLI